MKLIRCKISAFGKLCDFECEFSSGLNTIKQDNGWGKSTLAAFIKSMFYGLDDGKRSVAENERIKYRPWNSTGTFGGSVIFEWGGKEYRLERFFGAKKSDDTVRLFDNATGKEFGKTENLGARVFQIDEEGFLSTTFFSQKDFEVKSNTSLTAKFNEVNEIQDSALFDKAVEKLEAKAKSYKYSGNRGLIPEIKAEQFAVGEKIERAGRAGREAAALKESAKKLEAETEEIKKRCDELVLRIQKAGKAEAVAVKKERYVKAVNERNSLTERKVSAERVFNGVVPDETTVSGIQSCVEELNRNAEREIILAEDIEMLEKTRNYAQDFSGKRNLSVAFLIFAALCAVAGVVFCIINVTLAAVAAFVVAAVFGSLCAFNFFGKKRSNDGGGESMLAKKKADLAEYLKIDEAYKANLEKVMADYEIPRGYGYSFALNEIKKTVETIKSLSERIKNLDEEIKELVSDESILAERKVTESVHALKAELDRAQAEYREKTALLAARNNDVKNYLAEADALRDYENRRDELSEKLAEYESELETVKTTLDFLKVADENLKVKYRAPLKDSLNKYLRLITGGWVADIDTDLKVTIEEKGGNRETDFYSKGSRNLFEICKRFALTDVLFTAEKPFIILDDPFYNLDDEKIKQSLSLIKKLSESYQIIYLVCHESRRA